MRRFLILLVFLGGVGCSFWPKKESEVFLYWGPESLEYWEEVERERLCSIQDPACEGERRDGQG